MTWLALFLYATSKPAIEKVSAQSVKLLVGKEMDLSPGISAMSMERRLWKPAPITISSGEQIMFLFFLIIISLVNRMKILTMLLQTIIMKMFIPVHAES